MSDAAKSKRSRKHRGNRRKHKNNKPITTDSARTRKPNEPEDEEEEEDEEVHRENSQQLPTETVPSENNREVPGKANAAVYVEQIVNIPSFETISEISIKLAENYTVESPQQTLKPKEKKKIQHAPKSKSLDNEDDAVLNIVELEAKSSDDDKSYIENSAIITEAESDVEWEVADNFKHSEEAEDATKKETDLRLFLKTLNLVDSPAEPPPPVPPPLPELIVDDFKDLPPLPVNDLKLKKAQKKAALEEHCIAQFLRPRFLDIIDEEGSNDSGDTTRRESMLSDRSSKYVDDVDDDVFVVEKKAKEPLEYFPKHKDYLTCKKDLRRQQECKLVGAKIIESEFEEGCGSWTIESTERQRGAEIVYLDDSSSSTSENNEDINESELIEVDERVNIKTPVIELNSQYGVNVDSIPVISNVDFNYSNKIENGEIKDSTPENIKAINLQTAPVTPGNTFAANEELIESLENLLVSAPTPVACNEVIMLANEFVDELPIVTEVLKESKSSPHENEISRSNRTILYFDENNVDSLSSCTSGEESASKDNYSRQDSSSSVCSSSHSTSHSTAKYNPLSSSLTDIDALVHDDLMSVVADANSPVASKERAAVTTNLCENVTGEGEKSEDSAKAPSPLKELCVGKVASLPYGNVILKELAAVSQSLSNFASEALSREMPDVMQMKPEVPEVPPRSPQEFAVKTPMKPKLPPALQLEKIPPPVAPRQSSFKVLHEEPTWVGLQSQKDPALVAYLSPLQKKQIETVKNYSSDEAGELIDMHRKYAERRGYDEMLANSEKEPSASNNNDDKIAVQVERPAPDTGNRLLAIIRDPSVNPNVQQPNFEAMQNSIESSFDFIETLRTFEDMNKDLANDHRFRSWSKNNGNVKETLEIAEHTTSNKTFKATTKPGNYDSNDFTLKPIKENVIVENDNTEIVKNGIDTQKSHEKIVKITMENDVKNAPDNRDAKTKMQSLMNKREFLLDDPVFKSDVLKNFTSFSETSTKRRGSLPKEIHDRQIEYILQKEKEIQEQIRQLEEEKRLAHFESKIVTESSFVSSNNSNTVKESEQSVTVNGKQTHFESSKESQNLKAGKITNLISAPSEGEKFREQMYCEYMDKVAEREERKQNRVIKISNAPATETIIPVVHEKSAQCSETSKRTCSEIEEEFISKAKERWDKMGFKDPESRDSPVVIEHKVKVLDGEGEKDVKKLPTHLQEFVEFTSNGDQSGVWTPGAGTSPGEATSSVGTRNRPAVNGEVSSPPQAAPAAPPPPPPPPPPIWSPTTKKASPIPEKREFRPVAFESPKPIRKQINQDQPNPEKKTPPPWEVRLAGSQSAPDAGGLSGLVAPQLPPQPALPRAQNPTITLLQKAREGQLPRGASYLEQDRDLPNDRRLSPPRVYPGETVYSLRRGYMSEPESSSDRPRKMAEIRPKQYEGIGPTTKDGMPIVLRSEVKEGNQSKWYKKMYDTIHKNKFDAHPSTIHTAPRSSQYAYFNPKSGYLSEPEGGGGNAGWSSDAYDSDAPTRRHSALDRRRASDKENVVNSQYLPSNKYSTLASAKASQEVYKNQPGRIEDYIPGRSSVVDKEAKQQLSNPPNQQPQLNSKHNVSSSILSKSYMARALKESGYESDSTLVLRRREGGPLEAPLSPQEQKLAYRSLQAGGEPPLQGFRKPAPDKPKESPRRYVESDVTIHYRVPVRQEPRPLVPEDELARRQADHMRRVYQEERRRKYLQELQDMNSRRHTDNFTPSQKSPISLNRYDSFGTRQVARALYNFMGQGARELSFRKGDLILVRRQIDNNWYEGEHNNNIGLFPYNYVEMIQYDSTTTPSQRRPTEGRARAKFNFVAQTHLELGLRKGELVTLIRRVDDNWYEGRLGDRKGIFPVSYVEVLAEPTMNRSELPSSIGSGKPVASPAAHSMVTAAGAASLGPHRYTPQLNSPALSNSPSSTAPLALPNHGITSHHARPASATLPRATDHTPVNLNNHEPLFVDTNAEAVPYRAMYKYRPQNPDELELQEGDTVYVLEKCDDGWYVGSSQRTGRFGTFPGNYVEKI
ncbi:uncharacterized protein LOC143918987 isoform X3 [Arctopsyche grandis]|uniref:uncharacterized protein LOC143918987 isoform X3 n=1 Tax=Arctopsyche grandis TaxID=121162 RepID=UPI00406D971E